MKILFLDIDGVLNHYNSKTPLLQPKINNLDNPIVLSMLEQLNQDNIINLTNFLIKYPNIKIVITSSWKNKYNLTDFKKLFIELSINNEIIDVTKNLGADSRADEIFLWLTLHQDVSNFAILDDCYIIPLHNEFKLLNDNFFKINKMKGFIEQDSIKLISHFQEKKC